MEGALACFVGVGPRTAQLSGPVQLENMDGFLKIFSFYRVLFFLKPSNQQRWKARQISAASKARHYRQAEADGGEEVGCPGAWHNGLAFRSAGSCVSTPL